MEIILLERIGRLGQMGDVVRVKDGYARNFLLPQGKALRATKNNMKRFEVDRAQLEARNLEQKTEAASVGEKVEGESFVIIRQASDSGQLYGSVATRDIAELVTAGGCSIERRQVMLERPIKLLGLHDVRITLHPEVIVKVTVNVARTEEEAERQAKGEDVTIERDDDDDAPVASEEVFEDEALAKEAEAALEDAPEGEVEGAAEGEAAAQNEGDKSESGDA